MKEVFSPCPPGNAAAFSFFYPPCRRECEREDGILTLFFSFGCYFPEERCGVKGAMSDRLCLLFLQGCFFFFFGGDLKLLESLGTGDSSEMSV